MTRNEIQDLQVGNYVLVNGKPAMVTNVGLLSPEDNLTSKWVRKYSGVFIGKNNLREYDWIVTDSPELNKCVGRKQMEDIAGIPIPENFEKLNGTNLWNDPKAMELYQYVHLYQNEWNRYEGIKDNWII